MLNGSMKDRTAKSFEGTRSPMSMHVTLCRSRKRGAPSPPSPLKPASPCIPELLLVASVLAHGSFAKLGYHRQRFPCLPPAVALCRSCSQAIRFECICCHQPAKPIPCSYWISPFASACASHVDSVLGFQEAMPTLCFIMGSFFLGPFMDQWSAAFQHP